MPTSIATVRTRDLTRSFEYPFLIATILTPWPRALINQKKGIVIILTRKGPIIGTMAIKAPKPAKTCVNIPNITVEKTTSF